MDPSALAGRTLGEFEVIERVAVGGFGEVFRARQTTLGRDAIIKVLNSDVSEVARDRFTREAQLASQLDHPFAAHIYAFGVEGDGRQWIAMELVRGITLSELLDAQGPLPVSRFVPLFQAICQVVQVAHEQGIVHRDLKPSNVMVVARAGVLLPKLLDLGIARLYAATDVPDRESDARAERELDKFDHGVHELLGEKLAEIARTPQADSNLTGGAQYLGSPPYMAPEQWLRPHAAGPPVDIYALGILAFECLMGKRPYDGATVTDVARAHLQPLPQLGSTMPPGLHAVLAKATAKRAKERYPSAIALSKAVETACRVEYSALPRAPSDLLASVFARAPQPLAETVAAADAATRADEAITRYRQVCDVIADYLGILAFASWNRLGRPDADGQMKWLVGLICRGSSARVWLELATEVTKPFARMRDAFPIPELVDLCHPRDGAMKLGERINALLATHEHADPEKLGELVNGVADLLPALADLFEYDLAVKTERGYEKWTGTRRRPHPLIDTPIDTPFGAPLAPDGAALLLDRNRAPVLSLWPLAKAFAPTTAAELELFLFAGLGRYGARLVAHPSGFERQDPELAHELEQITGAARDAADAEDGRAPYRGLSSFSVSDNEFFFGRERESENLANHLRAHSFAAVVGPSGAGKSSFVQAGVVPLLPKSWRAVVMRPGASPFAALYARLGDDMKPPLSNAEAIAKPAALLDWLQTEVRKRNETLLIYVDQGEELVTLCRDETERTAFAELVTKVRDDERIRVVMTLRDDFLMRMQRLLGERLTTGMQLLGTPSRADLRRILTEPARRLGYELEDQQLVEEMVGAVVDNPSALALLSFTASRLWELRDRQFKKLRRRVYSSLGGVGGALAQHAEEVIVNMTPDERELVHEAFRHLVTADGTRAVIAKSELIELLGKNDAASKVVEALVDARLCVTAETASGVTIEITHEALLESWPRLVTWRREDSENARLRDRLRASARQWNAEGRQRGMLWRGDVLVEYRLWRSRYRGRLAEIEESFAAACLRDEARGKRIRRAVTATAFAILAGVAIALYVFGTRARESAAQATVKTIELLEEQGRRELLDFRPLRAAGPLTRAYQLGGTHASLRFLLARAMASVESQGPVLHGHTNFVRTATFSADGTRIVTSSDDDTVRLWSADTGAEIAKAAAPGVKRVARASRDRKLFAGAGADAATLWRTSDLGVAQRWPLAAQATAIAISDDGSRVAVGDARGHALLFGGAARDIEAHDGPASAAAIAPDGRVWATGGDDGKVAIVRDADVRKLAHGTSTIKVLAIDPAGTHVASGGADGVIKLWGAGDAPVATFGGHAKAIRDLAFSPDGAWLASASDDGTVRLWSVKGDAPAVVLSGHDNTVFSVGFDRDGRHVVTTGADGVVRLWDLGSAATIDALDVHRAEIWSAAIAPDGKRIVTTSFDNTARIWKLPARDEQISIAAGKGGFLGTTLDRRGTSIATAGGDGIARVARLDGTTVAEVRADGLLRVAALSPDGARLATGTVNGTAVLWQLASPPVAKPLEGSKGGVHAGVFSPDGQQLVLSGEDGVVRIFDPRTGAVVRRLEGHTAAVWGLSYSHDGALLASASDDSFVRVWDTATGALVRAIGPLPSPINSAVFDPSKTWIAAAGEDTVLRVISLADGAVVREVPAAGDIVTRVAFSDDGERIAVGSFDRSATLWDATTLRLLWRIRRHTEHVQGLHFLPDRDRVITTGLDGMVWVTDVSIEQRPPDVLLELVERKR